ncbi:radical SAM protein [Microcoleus sp. FACHB-1515]|uniref:radical SAM protein n=1 Tax=Cyanophyceae TaxID=3028117 RepID=UPI001685E9E1|nr:radical SAM protein [Microcoleus sp. FACHB-1515]MBD2090606.1 radical SAM protein [Microcoleus sp. FACHB-1515]
MRTDVAPVRNDATYPFLPPRFSQGKWHGFAPDGLLPQVHLYDGSMCNRACAFCCVSGSPQGWHRPYCKEMLDLALSIVSPTGKIKFYGGEPTLHPENVLNAVQYLRSQGFPGTFRIYSNGIRATELTQILTAVPEMDAVLNYSILHGRGATPIPKRSLEILLAFEPGRIFSGHTEIVDVGAPEATDPSLTAESFDRHCPHCHPVVRSDGWVHGCPFAVEIAAPHFELGKLGSDPQTILQKYDALVRWQIEVVEAEADRRGILPCQVCNQHLAELPLP